jgi:hypothetical protein
MSDTNMEQDVDESLSSALPVSKVNTKDLPEAGATAFTDVKTPNGFHWSFTLRSESGTDLVSKIDKFEKFCKLTHWEPQERRVGGFPKKEAKPIVYVEGRTCDKCGSRLVEKTKQDGKKYFKCEKGSWDAVAKKAIGCDFVDWNN